jgi:hypothetical protein
MRDEAEAEAEAEGRFRHGREFETVRDLRGSINRGVGVRYIPT